MSLLQVPGCSIFVVSKSMMPESVLTADNIGSTDITGDGTGCYLTVYVYMGSSEVKYCTSDSTDVTGDTCSTG